MSLPTAATTAARNQVGFAQMPVAVRGGRAVLLTQLRARDGRRGHPSHTREWPTGQRPDGAHPEDLDLVQQMRDHPAQRPPRGCDNRSRARSPKPSIPASTPFGVGSGHTTAVPGWFYPTWVLDVGGDPLVIIAAHGPETARPSSPSSPHSSKACASSNRGAPDTGTSSSSQRPRTLTMTGPRVTSE